MFLWAHTWHIYDFCLATSTIASVFIFDKISIYHVQDLFSDCKRISVVVLFSSILFRAYILGFTCKGPKIWYIWSAPQTSCRHFRPYSSVIIICNHAKVVNCHEDKCFKLTWRTYWNGQQICIISVFSPVYKPISLFCVNLSRKYIYLHLHPFQPFKAQVS